MSELTNERLEEYARDGRNAGDCEVEQMARELLALRTLRDAGDEEVDKWHVNAMHAIGVDESVNPEGCRSSQRSLEELHHLAITRGQQLREAQAEIENHKRLVGNTENLILKLNMDIATLTAERDEARSKLTALEVAVRNLTDTIAEMETRKEADKSNAAMSDRCNRVMRVLRDSGNADAESAFWIIAGDARDSRETIARLTAELAALKSCPAMAEVDALMEAISEAPNLSPRMKSAALKGADIARRSIASREEVVGKLSNTEGLIVWMVKHWDYFHLLEELADSCPVVAWKDNASEILAICSKETPNAD